MRESFPEVSVIHIELQFADSAGTYPSPQRHSFYPPARAFFRFSCPCSDCDGDFDLAGIVNRLLSKRPSDQSVSSGRMRCQGNHWREGSQHRACQIELTFGVAVGDGRTPSIPT